MGYASEHTLEKELVVSGLITFAVVTVIVHHFTVLTLDLEFTTVFIVKMLVFSAHVSQLTEELLHDLVSD